MEIDHIGYAVKKIDKAIDAFHSLGYVFEPQIDDKDRNIRVVFGEMDGCRIELVCPLERNLKSPVDQYLSSVGPTPYHICYKSLDFDKDIEHLKISGFKVIIGPREAVAFGGKRVIFLMSLGFGLMEIVEG